MATLGVGVPMIFGDLSVFRESDWRQQSRDLQALALGDFTPVQTALRALYPNTDLPLRAIPFVKRYVAELTGRYARPVVRRFRADGMGASWQLLQEAYTDGGVDASFDAVERALVVQGSLVLLPMPDARGVMRLHICQPWQVQAEYTDPEGAQRPDTWDKLTVQLPSTFAAEQVIYGQATITRDYAWRTIGGRQVGIYRQDGSNPFGRVPAVVVCFGDAYPGRWHGPVNQAVLNLQVAVCAQVSDNELIVRHCAFPQKVIENAEHSQIVESLQVGPDKVITIIGNGGTGPQPTMRVVQGAVPVAELANAIDNQIRLYCSMLGLDPSPFLKSNTATTASARLFAAQDRQELQDRIKPALLRAEIQTARLFAEWQTLSGVSVVPYRTLLVEVAYTDPVIVADPLHDAQALQLRIDMDLTSKAEVVAQERGISIGAAQAIVDRNAKAKQPIGVTDGAGATETGALATAAGVDVAATALNGAQVESLINIITLVTTGQLDAAAAKLVITSSFPTLPQADVARMVERSVSFTPAAPVDAAAPQPAKPADQPDDNDDPPEVTE